MKHKNLNTLAVILTILGTFFAHFVQAQDSCISKIRLQHDPESGKDAFVHSEPLRESLNFGDNPSFNVMSWTFDGSPGTLREYIQFNLNAIPSGSSVYSAKLTLFGKTELNGSAHSCLSGNNDFVIRRVTEAWDEHTITWLDQPTVSNLTNLENEVLVSAICTPEAPAMEINITDMVQYMVNNPAANYGIQVALQTEAFYRALIFHSSDSPDASKRPLLEIEFSNNVESFVFQPDASGFDAFVHSEPSRETFNYGDNPSFDAMSWTFDGSPGTLREYFQFDLSSLGTGTIINNAKLYLCGKTEANGSAHSCLSGTNEFMLSRVLAPWDEHTINWLNQPPVSALPGEVQTEGSLCTPADNVEIDVTSFVQEMVNNPSTNYGWQLALQTESYYRALIFHSSDSPDAEKRPKLVIQACQASVGTKQAAFEKNIHIFPNPVTCLMTLQFEQTIVEKVILNILDATGKLVFQEQLAPGTNGIEINTAPWPAGFYVASLTSRDGKTSHTKIIKQ